ncbi:MULTISPECIES: MarR family winged helix-turn-helix transcriptional regulator [Pontibacter]|uniref:DNA-binding transcriptional regulator, MarR family n=1 Tax=Pontibacter lucknowensis TaxID=1077936 RepID=A0A1N6V5F2_9BACT|nr:MULTISPECIES: MarR family transcriptional regulator [Pontibacter]EJF08976.1 MarR family transcriptional regulator [Pontibacter sp. BAB1700]SIQ72816.1 DNA-binding transcriptional regulator, MarR family [Pontibacter lucknowensis]
MRIEDEIQQKDFKDDHRRMVVNLLFTNNWLNQQFIPFFKQFGLTLQQHNVLSIVRGQQPKPVCFGEVQERMVDRNSNVTRLVDKLIEKGYVTRDICQANRRMIELRLTPKGTELLSQIDEQMPTFFHRFHNLTQEEAVLVSKLLDKLRG